jgi:hypothetical protein
VRRLPAASRGAEGSARARPWARCSGAVANASGDVIAEDGEVLGGPRGDRGQLLRSAELIRDMPQLPDWAIRPGQSTTLACVCTDATLDKRGCGVVARIASAGSRERSTRPGRRERSPAIPSQPGLMLERAELHDAHRIRELDVGRPGAGSVRGRP